MKGDFCAEKICLLFFILVLLSLFSGGCAADGNPPSDLETPMANVYTCPEHGAIRTGELAIGYGHTEYGKYTDSSGKSIYGHEVWLDIWTSEDPTSLMQYKSHPGEVISYQQHKIEILNLWNCGSLFSAKYCLRVMIDQ
jgi:hypothetical protein